MPNLELRITSRLKVQGALTDETLHQIEGLLPDQPWSKDIHKEIAQKLGCSHTIVSKAIRILIKRGVYNEQIDGKLYQLTPVPST